MEVTCTALAGVSIMVKRKLHKPTRWFNYHKSHYCYLWYPRHHKRPLVLNIEATSKEGKIVNFKSFCSLYFTGQHGLNTVGKWEKIKRLRNTNE